MRIAGGGLAGSLAALAMARLRPEVPLLLAGEEARFGGGRTLFFFDADLSPQERDLIAPLISRSWDAYYVAFPGRGRRLKLACHCIEAGRIDEALRGALKSNQYRLGAQIVAVRDNSLLLQGGETIAADGAIDAREATASSVLELGWRKSSARLYRLPAPHRVDLPVFADATVAQAEGCRFFSCIPFDEQRLLVEEVHYSTARTLDPAAAGTRIEAYLAARGWKEGTIEAEESEALALPLGGDLQAYWRIGGARVAKLGLRGGFAHPATGSLLADAARNALLLTEQRDFAGGALHDFFEGRATAAWKKRDFQRGFARLILRGATCAALDGLYTLDEDVVAGFHADRVGLLDRRRIMAAAGR